MCLRASRGSRMALIPSTRASPASGFNTVYRIRSVVDLPAPFGPRRPVIFPSPARRLTSRTAATLPNDFCRWLASIKLGACLRSWRRAVDRNEEGGRLIVARARDIEPGYRGALDKLLHHPIHAGRRKLPVAEILQDDVQAVGKPTPGFLAIFRRSDRVITSRKEQRRHVRVQRRVEVRVDRPTRPDLAHGEQRIELARTQ